VKAGIHPDYVDTTITCACGEIIRTRSTKPEIRVEVCSKCHPFFTGKQKLMDTAGRVERFQRKYNRQPTAAPEATGPGRARSRRAAPSPHSLASGGRRFAREALIRDAV